MRNPMCVLGCLYVWVVRGYCHTDSACLVSVRALYCIFIVPSPAASFSRYQACVPTPERHRATQAHPQRFGLHPNGRIYVAKTAQCVEVLRHWRKQTSPNHGLTSNFLKMDVKLRVSKVIMHYRKALSAITRPAHVPWVMWSSIVHDLSMLVPAAACSGGQIMPPDIWHRQTVQSGRQCWSGSGFVYDARAEVRRMTHLSRSVYVGVPLIGQQPRHCDGLDLAGLWVLWDGTTVAVASN